LKGPRQREASKSAMLINEKISFKRILCPVDLSSESSQALRYAIALAKAYDAKLFVLHCLDGAEVPGNSDPTHLQQVLESFIRSKVGAPLVARPIWENIIIEGQAEAEIARVAAELRADLIVMRSRRRPYAAALLGSVAESVCRTAPCPILVTHPQEREWVGETTNEIGLDSVLVAYDFSSDSELALSYGLSLAQEYRAELHVLHVLPTQPRQSSPEIAGLPLVAQTAFQNAVFALKGAVPGTSATGVTIRHAVREGRPYREVLAYAEEQNSDLVCMGASGTGFGMRALFGSNVDRVLRQAPCPILIARPLRPMIAAPSIQQLGKEGQPCAPGCDFREFRK
jgi:nucleotide-binding universal stress UspA family protein